MNIDAMKLIIRAARTAQQAAGSLSFINGNRQTKLDDIFGSLVDAIYLLCNEETTEISDSMAYKLIHNTDIPVETAAEMIVATMV